MSVSASSERRDPRLTRLAELAAKALQMPVGLIDLADGRPLVVGADEAERWAAHWTPPASRDGPAISLVDGPSGPLTVVAIPVVIKGRQAWIGAIGRGDAPPPASVLAVQHLIAELQAETVRAADTARSWLARLEHENRQMNRAQRLMGVGTVNYDFLEDQLDLSPAAVDILGGGRFGSLGDLLIAFDPFDRSFVHRVLTGVGSRGDVFDFEREIDSGDGGRRLVRVNGEVMRAEGSPSYMFATVHDMSSLRGDAFDPRTSAEHDRLTGVYNRSMLDATIAKATLRAGEQRVHAALFIIDVDNFKDINDTYGREAGDDVLRFVARALASIIRGSDTVIRLGGDEFAVVISGLPHLDGVNELAGRIRTILTSRVNVGATMVEFSVSVGVAVYPEDVSEGVDAYRAASQALFEAKAEGGNRLKRFDPALREQREEHRAFTASVRAGLLRNEFLPFFQPKLDLRTGTVVGFEALCRWRHPVRGTLGPAAFFRAFEDRDIGGPLSDVALVGSFKAVRGFHEYGVSPGHIAVNLNQTQLERVDLVPQVERLTKEYGAEPSEILFEVVENVLIRDKRVVYDNLTELFHRGYRVALDDFGTGFASLTHIREPFIREVKIDRSFVTNSALNPLDRQIVAAIVQMARKLGLSVVAEGIEDEETIKNLRSLGCTLGQGFVFSHALPFEEALQFVGRQERIMALLDDSRL
ncbi:putative bifunctional diguanylate cyclase/phosphodiesterase [Acuticoccus kandeliae]|uniref:putative bifunctional diguanylate cyclase/phosphodiesterase n=1 Tax=Acuticoccus kandeliae TaxID=2073160 RepID=UPI0014743511|nr:GGDEF domain-containing phosphodiesterase [Acuticoccus kandeliae]